MDAAAPDAGDGGMIGEMANRLFADLATRRAEGFAALWPSLEEAGFASLLVPESAGGFGGGWHEMFLVQRLAGYHALAAPLGECALATHLLAGIEAPGGEGLLAIAAGCEGEIVGDCFSGRLSGIPWGRHAKTIVAECGGSLFAVAAAGGALRHGENMAGEPRDTLDIRAGAVTCLPASTELFALGALLRVGQIAGALDRAFELSVSYANERVQFGKPIAKFQAVQQSLAVFAEQLAAAISAGQSASAAQQRGAALFEIAAAKLRADMAVDIGAAVAHQVHGAIGFTQDYALHHATRRLMAWRAEFGHDRFWAERLGRMVTGWPARDLWQGLTLRGDSC